MVGYLYWPVEKKKILGYMRLADIKGKNKLFKSFNSETRAEIEDSLMRYIENEDDTKSQIYYSRMMKAFEKAKTDSQAKELAKESKAMKQMGEKQPDEP